MTLSSTMAKKKQLGAYAMEGVAAGAHLPTSRLFEPAKRPNDRADHCLDCSFPSYFPSAGTRYLFFTVEWSGARLETNSGDDSAQ